jgi:hypothetical protein
MEEHNVNRKLVHYIPIITENEEQALSYSKDLASTIFESAGSNAKQLC